MLAFNDMVELFGSEEDVPESLEIDVIETGKIKTLLSPEQFEIDVKKMWGVLT